MVQIPTKLTIPLPRRQLARIIATAALLTCSAYAGRPFFESWPDIDMRVAGPLRAVEVEGQRVEYYDVGQGPVVLLLHGARCDASDWKQVIPPLKKHFRLIIQDSMIYPRDPVHTWLLMDHLGIQRFAIIGHSGGDSLGRPMYWMRPERIWAYVNVDSGGSIGGRSFADQLPNSRCSPHVQALHRKNDAELAKLEASRVNDFPSDVNLARLKLAYRQRLLRPDLKKPMEQIPPGRATPPAVKVNLTRGSLEIPKDTSGRWKCPCLIFNAGYGKADAGNPPETTEKWKGGPFRADVFEFVWVRDSGHWIFLDQPGIFVDRTLKFLRRYAPRG